MPPRTQAGRYYSNRSRWSFEQVDVGTALTSRITVENRDYRQLSQCETRGPTRIPSSACAIDSGIITTADVAKVFTPKEEELATGKDYIDLAFNLGKLAHSIDWFEACVKIAKENGASPEDLAHTLGLRSKDVASVEDLERLFRLE